VCEDVLSLGGDLRLDFQVFGIEAPELVTAAPLVFRGLVLLDGAEEVVNLFEFILVEKFWVAQEFGQVFPVALQVLINEPISQQLHRI